MSRQTLLEIVQDTLSLLDSDEANSISDTVEAEQIANIAKQCYLNLASFRHWPWERRLIHLDAVGDGDKPTLLKIPENVNRIERVLYNRSCDELKYEELTHLDVYDFILHTYTFDATASNTGSYTLLTRPDDEESTITVLYKNDSQPRYWTSVDDTFIIFDTYDSTAEDTIQSSNSLTWAELQPTFIIEDDFVPNLPEQYWQMYLNDVRVTAFVNLKQAAHPKYAADLRRNMIRLQKAEWRQNGNPTTPNYGRK